MTDDYETLMRYQNEFIDYMADEGVKIIDVIDVTIIHSGTAFMSIRILPTTQGSGVCTAV